MLVSGKAALHANSDKHLTASWNESIVEEKYLSKILAVNMKKKMYYMHSLKYKEKKNW